MKYIICYTDYHWIRFRFIIGPFFFPQKNNTTMCLDPFILILFQTYFALEKSVKIPRIKHHFTLLT